MSDANRRLELERKKQRLAEMRLQKRKLNEDRTRQLLATPIKNENGTRKVALKARLKFNGGHLQLLKSKFQKKLAFQAENSVITRSEMKGRKGGGRR